MTDDTSEWSRRQWLKRFVVGGPLSALAAFTYGAAVERHLLTYERLTIRLPNLGSGLVGKRIVQISDLHLRPVTEPEMIEKTVRAVNAMSPDIIVITGDFITERGDSAEELGEILSRLKAPHGVYGVLGNHDCWHRPALVLDAMQKAGIDMMVNRGRSVTMDGSPLWIGGTDSVWAGRPDLTRALPSDQDMPTLLMVHEPDYVDAVAKTGRHLLQVSGHSHGGQVRVPFVGAPVTVSWGKKYVRGYHRISNVQLYVNRGIGCTGKGVRFACPPEITEFTLVA